MTDLMDFAAKKDEVVVELKNPVTEEVLSNDDGSPQTVTLYAPHTKEFKSVVYAKTDEKIKRKSEELSAEQLETDEMDLICSLVKTWNITAGGEQPKATAKKVREILSNPKLFWIKPQLEGGLESFEAFT